MKKALIPLFVLAYLFGNAQDIDSLEHDKSLKKGFLTEYIEPHLTTEHQSSAVDQLPLLNTEKVNLINNFDMIFNTRSAFRSNFSDGKHQVSKFNMDQFRLEIKGKIHDKVYIRFRDRYTRDGFVGTLDNISRTTDIAMIRVQATPRTQISVGKLVSDWGGYEFDYNPIEVLAFNDIIDNAESFLVGVGLTQVVGNNNSFGLQILNNSTKELNYALPNVAPDIENSETPLAIVTNWRGSYWGGAFETIWSYAHYTEAKNMSWNYVALGNKFHKGKLVLMYDFQWSHEDLDRTGVVSNNLGFLEEGKQRAQNTTYLEHWVRSEYQFNKRLSVRLTLMTSNAYWKEKSDNERVSTSYGVIPTIEFSPFSDMLSFRLFASYVGRWYNFQNDFKTKYQLNDRTTNSFSIGIIAPLHFL